MTALVGVFGQRSVDARDALPRMLGAMSNRASTPPDVFERDGVLLAVSEHPWEREVEAWTGPRVIRADDWVIAADASLYYVRDLRRSMAQHGFRRPEATTADLVLGAIRLFGDQFARHLEGDFAIVAWERRRDRVLLTRDFAGSRALAYARIDDAGLVVATSPTAVVEHPGVSRAFDLDFVGAAAAGLMGHGYGTGFDQVKVVPGGATLAFERGRITEVDRIVPPPFNDAWEDTPSDEAAGELRHLLEAAVMERLPNRGSAVVWMSGGWDSTSVFAAGRSAIERTGSDVDLQPVSMRYPPGDRGDESHFIQSVADRWSARVRWVAVDEIPLIRDADTRARKRDDPRLQPFESQVRFLAGTTREQGTRVVLDGVGGDHLFLVSGAAELADHLLHVRLAPLFSAWKEWGAWRRRDFLRTIILPNLAPDTLDWLASLRGGRPLAGFWDWKLPPWIVARPGLAAQLKPELHRDPGESPTAFEARQGLATPLLARATSWNQAMALDEGISIRSPFLDPRVIRFAAGRPASERRSGGNSKIVLRESMRELLPTDVLRSRPSKTGLPIDYFKRHLQPAIRTEFRAMFGHRRSILEEMGLVMPAQLSEAVEEYGDSGLHSLGALLHITIEVERWLAAHEGQG